MSQNRILNVEPIAITTSVANLLNCDVTSLSGPTGLTLTQPFMILRHVRLINTTAAAITVKLWKGATGASAAGSEWGANAYSIAANSYVDWYGQARFDSGDYLTGQGSADGVTMNAEGEIGFS
jgi:hypothetical protein